MNPVWTIFLALVAGAGGPCVPPAPVSTDTRPAFDSSARALGPGPSRSVSASRKCWHGSPFPGDGSTTGLQEFDTEEVDETCVVDLDAVSSMPALWDGLGWSHPASPSRAIEVVPPLTPSSFPLRC